jgi:D-xylulose reductase
VHFWNHGGVNGNNVSNEKPLIMGHEASGVVHAIGPDVNHKDFAPGMCVAIEPSDPCRVCAHCKRGKYNLCGQMKFAACPPDTHGCLTKFYKMPADFAYPLPLGFDLKEAVLAEPLAVGAHAARMVDVKPGDSVVVMGAGTIGLCSAVVSSWFGAKKVILVDIQQRKLDFAQGLIKGCETINSQPGEPAEDIARAIIDRCGLGEGSDALIEATGAETCIEAGVNVLRKGGHYVQTGLGKNVVQFPIVTMSEKELHMHGACRYGPEDFRIALDVLVSRRWDMASLISRVFQFEQTTQAWDATKNGEGIKNMICVGGDLRVA